MFTAILVAASLHPARAQAIPVQAKTNLQVSIAIPESTMALGIQDRQVNMYVSFFHGGSQEVRFWGEWCSWGYECLSFELAPVDGGPIKVVRRLPRGWDKNHPYTINATPGRHFARPVAFGDGTWSAFPVAKDTVGKFRIRAVYEIPEGEFVKEFKVWTGRAESNWETVEFRNHMDR